MIACFLQTKFNSEPSQAEPSKAKDVVVGSFPLRRMNGLFMGQGGCFSVCGIEVLLNRLYTHHCSGNSVMGSTALAMIVIRGASVLVLALDTHISCPHLEGLSSSQIRR
jgi:hypothetical protein